MYLRLACAMPIAFVVASHSAPLLGYALAVRGKAVFEVVPELPAPLAICEVVTVVDIVVLLEALAIGTVMW